MPRAATLSKRPQLTLAQLSAYDDILTDALVDHVRHTLDFFSFISASQPRRSRF